MMDFYDRVLVNCLFDLGLNPAIYLGGEYYMKLRQLVARILADNPRDPADLLYESMTEHERDLVLILAENLTTVPPATKGTSCKP